MSPEIWNVISVASRWFVAFFALMLLVFALSWHHADRKSRRDRFRNLPGAGTIGELIVLSGNDELPPNTWFPVPREGVLGSLRSCDLVIPCPGVRSQHLDFSWQDGTGLLIRPRLGCEALIDGIPVSRRGINADTPLLHGSVLQVGCAVLRLQLFSALSHTNRPFSSQNQTALQGGGTWMPQVPPSVQDQSAQAQPWYPPTYPLPPQPDLLQSRPPVPGQVPPDQEAVSQARQQAAPRRSRTDCWKEDWSE